MEHFCVITNVDKVENYQVAQEIAEYLQAKGKSCYLLDNRQNYEKGICHFTDADTIPADTQCALVLGGDGTMIQAAIDLVHCNIPILGINMGTVGFLTETERHNLDGVLEKLVNDDFFVENRIMLKETDGKNPGRSCYALNDIVVSKRGSCRLITIKVYLNGELADIYRADGLIVSTPTGSTGYNLSAGGPVMAPHTHATVITPICAHSLNKRSLVLSAEDRITLEIGQTKEAQEDLAVLAVDGRNVGEFVTGDRLDICVPDYITKIVKLSGITFYEKMRDKLNGN